MTWSTIIVYILLACLALWREYSWYRHSVDLKSKIILLQTDMKTIKTYLIEPQDSSCTNASECPSFDDITRILQSGQDSSIKSKTSLSAPKPTLLYNRSGVTIACLLYSMKLYEALYAHNIFVKSEFVDNNAEASTFRAFVTLWSPVTIWLVFSVLLMWGVVAWLGLADRQQFVTYGLKVVINIALVTPLVQVSVNALGARKYLPTSIAKWKESVMRLDWWLWLLGKTTGIRSIVQCIYAVIVFVLGLLAIWPYRYYFFYGSTCAHHEATTIFLVNMLTHASFFLSWICAVYIDVLATPPEFKKSWLVQTICPYFYVRYRFVFTFAQALNVGICLFRILWAALLQGCSWYGSAVTLLFAAMYIAVGALSLCIMGSLIYAPTFAFLHKSVFVDGFVRQHKKSSLGRTANNDEFSGDETRKLEEFACALFDTILYQTIRNYTLCTGPINFSNVDEREKLRAEYRGKYEFTERRTGDAGEEDDRAVEPTVLDLHIAFDYFLAQMGSRSEHLPAAVRICLDRKAGSISKKNEKEGEGEEKEGVDNDNDKDKEEEKEEVELTVEDLKFVFGQLLGTRIL